MVVHLFLNNNKALDFLPINSIKNGGITFGWEFIDLPAPRLLVSLVSQFKVFLYLMSVLIFCSVGFLLISALSTVVLIIYSFCNKNFLQEK